MDFASTTEYFNNVASTTGDLIVQIGFPLFFLMVGILLALIFAGGIIYAVMKSIKRF